MYRSVGRIWPVYLCLRQRSLGKKNNSCQNTCSICVTDQLLKASCCWDEKVHPGGIQVRWNRMHLWLSWKGRNDAGIQTCSQTFGAVHSKLSFLAAISWQNIWESSLCSLQHKGDEVGRALAYWLQTARTLFAPMCYIHKPSHSVWINCTKSKPLMTSIKKKRLRERTFKYGKIILAVFSKRENTFVCTIFKWVCTKTCCCGSQPFVM